MNEPMTNAPARDRDAFMRALADVTRGLVSFDSVSELSGSLERFGRSIGAESVHILEHVPVPGTRGFFWQQVGWTLGSDRPAEQDPLLQEIPVDQGMPHMYDETITSGHSLCEVHSAPQPEATTLPGMQLQALLTVRLDSGDRPWGALAIGWREHPATLDRVEIDVLSHSIAPLGMLIERSRGAQAIRTSLERYRMLTETIKDVVWVLDVERLQFTYVSPSVLGLRGYTDKEVILHGAAASMAPEQWSSLETIATDQLERFHRGESVPTEFVTAEVQQPCKDGSWVWTEAIIRFNVNERTGRLEVIGVSRDISERKRLEDALRNEASTDELTGLANRREFLRIAEEEIARSRRYGHDLALCIFDVDELKALNDRLGHLGGDTALKHFASNLRHHTRGIDTAARFGGDEFVLLLPETGVDGATAAIARINDRSRETALEYNGETLIVIAAAGYAVLAPEDTGIDSLLARADAALYATKRNHE